MSSINITGEKKPYSGSFYEYQVKLSEPATSIRNVAASVLCLPVFFIINA